MVAEIIATVITLYTINILRGGAIGRIPEGSPDIYS